MTTSILIIEDEPIIAMDLEMIVTDLGHRVVGIASTKGEALDLAWRCKPDLILSDVNLADGSKGMDVVAAIRARHDVPFVFITAYPAVLLNGRQGEQLLLIEKPFTPLGVETVIAQALATIGH